MRDSGCGGGESRCRVEGTQSGLRGARGGRTNPSPGGNNILPGRLRGFRARKSLSAGLSRRRETKRNKQGFYRRQGEELGSSGSGPGGSRVPSPPCSPTSPPCPRRGKRRRPPAPRCAPAGLTRGVPVPSLPGPTFAVVPCPPPRRRCPLPAPGSPRIVAGSAQGRAGGRMGRRWGPGPGPVAAERGGTGRHREAPEALAPAPPRRR